VLIPADLLPPHRRRERFTPCVANPPRPEGFNKQSLDVCNGASSVSKYTLRDLAQALYARPIGALASG